ncbi:hypothetical protein Tco_0930775 [Tanacetum coccineum]
MTPAQLRQYMRTYVKNQGPAVYTTGWTMAQVRKLSPEQLQEEFDKIQRAVAFTRGLKRDGSPMTTAFSKKLKTGDVEVDVEAPSHGVPQEVEVEAPSQDVSREKVDAPSHSQNIPEAQVEVPSQEATVEDVEVPSNIASKAQQTASSLKKVGTKKKLLGRKGVHTSQSTIPIEEGDPDAEHKLCIKYASDEDSASDCDTPVHLYGCYKKLRELGPCSSGDLKILMDSPEVNDGNKLLDYYTYVCGPRSIPTNNLNRKDASNHQLRFVHGTVGIFKYARQDSSRLDVAAKFIFQSSRFKTEDLSRNWKLT